MSSSEAGPLAAYNSLTDKHLCGFFRNARTQRHLRRMGLITKRGEVVSEEMFRISHARREHKKHVRELLAQAIVHKTLDLERTRQIQIRNRLEEMAKRELVERVRSERSLKGDEDVLSLMSPRSKPRTKSSSAVGRNKKSKNDDNSLFSDENTQEFVPSERPKSSKSTKSMKSNIEIDANGLPVFKRNDEVVDSQYLSQLTPRALRQFTMSLTNIDYMSGISPYVLPQVEPVPPRTPRNPPRSSTAGTPRNATGGSRSRARRVTSLHPPHEEVQHTRRLETQVKVSMKYLGVLKEKWNNSGRGSDLMEDEADEILLMQQHCGGNTYPVFKGYLFKNTEFVFFSKRHRGYPFSITLYVNGKSDSRISTCCEFKHSPKGSRPFVRLGGKLGRFAFGKTESENNEGMCYKCRADAKLALESKQKAEDEYDEDFQYSFSEEEDIDYKVAVYTGEEAGAGTDARVKVNLVGEEGESGWVELDRKGVNDFERGSVDKFELKLKPLGKLTKLIVTHDGSGFGSAWFLEKAVVESAGKSDVFWCNKWLSDDVDDKEITRTLVPGSSTAPKTKDYSVTVYTGGEKLAGTDANVFVSITGANGQSPTKLLDKFGVNDFERNSKGTYKIKSLDLGEVQQLRVWHDGSGIASAWFLDKIVVSDGDSKYFFFCKDWLADNMPGKITYKVLDAKSSETEYSLAVLTGDEEDGGTDADVYVQLFGSLGDSGMNRLERADEDDFTQGSHGRYKINCAPLGKLEKLKIWHNGKGASADWFLEKVEVSNDGVKTFFPCEKWLSDSRGEGKTELILLPGEENQTQVKKDVLDYEFTVYTGDVSGAGTNSNVYMTLNGEDGDSGVLSFDKAGRDDFERASKCVFAKKFDDVGKLLTLKVWHDGSGIGSGWYLDKVEVKCKGQVVEFHCENWLDEDEGDGLTERVLHPHVPEFKPKQSKSYFAEGLSDEDDTSDFDVVQSRFNTSTSDGGRFA